MVTSVLAHQGGWDEILMVAGPLLLIAAALVLAKRRADRLVPRPDPPSTDAAPPGAPEPGDGPVSPPGPPTRRAR